MIPLVTELLLLQPDRVKRRRWDLPRGAVVHLHRACVRAVSGASSPNDTQIEQGLPQILVETLANDTQEPRESRTEVQTCNPR